MSETEVYTRACALSELPVEGVIGVEVEGEPVAVARTGGEVFALRDVCSHTITRWSAGCTGRASTCAPASPPGCRPPSRFPSIQSRSKATTSTSRSPRASKT